MASGIRSVKALQLLATALLLPSICLAQAARVPTLTRTVQLFGDLERNLADAKDADSEAALLTDDFEERLCATPGIPIPRAEWLLERRRGEYKFSQEAVHMLTSEAIYSALRTEGNHTDAVVDVWRKEPEGWKLSVRYRCPASGATSRKSTVEKKY